MWQRELTAAVAAGTVLAGKYCVEREVGAGGMGVVLAVRHRELDELYALKLMHPVAAASSGARERFAREAKAAAKLRSDHVARAIDFGFLDDDGPPYMVLELLQGENLAELLAANGPLDPQVIARWMLEACDALREAHELGIVHRDLKPSNLFLARRASGASSIKVLDFGIAKTVAADSGALTKTSMTMGSPYYMSPEQMRSAKTADSRSDVWSLGVTMYELSTGQVPFQGESVTEVAIAVIECEVASPLVHRPELPPDFVHIVLTCLAKRPERRFQSVDELAEALATFTGGEWTSRPRAVITDIGGARSDSAATGLAPGAEFAKTEEAQVGGVSRDDPPPARPAASTRAFLMGAGAAGVVAFAAVMLMRSEDKPAEPQTAAATPSASDVPMIVSVGMPDDLSAQGNTWGGEANTNKGKATDDEPIQQTEPTAKKKSAKPTGPTPAASRPLPKPNLGNIDNIGQRKRKPVDPAAGGVGTPPQ